MGTRILTMLAEKTMLATPKAEINFYINIYNHSLCKLLLLQRIELFDEKEVVRSIRFSCQGSSMVPQQTASISLSKDRSK